jgi:hypothetical protein
MDEGSTAVRVAVGGHFTPSIDETDDNAAGNENAVYFEDVHTASCEYAPGISQHLGVRGTDLQRCIFDRGTAVEYYTHCGRKAHAGVESTGG